MPIDVLALAFVAVVRPGPIVEQAWTFDDAEHTPVIAVSAEGEGKRRSAEPRVKDGSLQVLDACWKYAASAALPSPSADLFNSIDVSFDLSMTLGTEGMGFAWLSARAFESQGKAPPVEKWEEPGIPATFAVGFDASDPVNNDPFRGSGNVYNRPQHEVSLHWNGAEIVKRVSPNDFRDAADTESDAPAPKHAVRIHADFVVGGADVSVWIDNAPVFDRYFIAGMLPYPGRPVFGARNADTAGEVVIDSLRVALDGPIAAPEPPTTVVAIDHAINDAVHPSNEAAVAFPSDTDRFGRIIGVLTLDKPETRFDPWDRIAHVEAFVDPPGDEGGEPARFELIRYITPYHRGHEWRVDLTDFRPILRGNRRVRQVCSTQGEGWVVSLRFEFYPGPAERLATRVVRLWSGEPVIGDPDRPVAAFYAPRHVELRDGEAFAKIRAVVTGHGMLPNSNNAGEFMPIGRVLTINGTSFRNRLWKDDNYLNPCRPQGGTWKYDRAGWAPGDVVRPWEVDATALIGPGRTIDVTYTLDPYVNDGRGKTWAPTHVTEAYAILYRSPASTPAPPPAPIRVPAGAGLSP